MTAKDLIATSDFSNSLTLQFCKLSSSNVSLVSTLPIQKCRHAFDLNITHLVHLQDLSPSGSPFDHCCFTFYFPHSLTHKEPGLYPHSSAYSPLSDPLPSRTSTMPMLLNLSPIYSLLSTLSAHYKVTSGQVKEVARGHTTRAGFTSKLVLFPTMLYCLPFGNSR